MSVKTLLIELPLKEVVDKLEDAPKEMAPRLSPIDVSLGGTHFACSVRYQKAFAVLIGDTKSLDPPVTSLRIEYGVESFRSNLILFVLMVLFSTVLEFLLGQPKGWQDWLEMPLFAAVLTGVPILLSLSGKGVVDRFIKNQLPINE